MTYNLDGTGKKGGGGSGGGGGYVGGGGTKTTSGTIGGSPGLLTSTGGLTGLLGACYQPFFNPQTRAYYLALIDPTNFDTEEDGFYNFPEPDAPNGVGRVVTIHRVVMTYREIDKAKFNFGIETYLADIDDFVQVTVPIVIAPPNGNKKRALSFPDGKIHTKRFGIVATGERPQPFTQRLANSGAYSIIKVVLCGNADEQDQI